MYIKQIIGHPGNPCWEINIECDEENVCIRFTDVDSKEHIGVALSPTETLQFIEAVKLMFKVQQSEEENHE